MLKLHTVKLITKFLQFENLLLHDKHIPGVGNIPAVGSAVEDGLLIKTAYNIITKSLNSLKFTPV